MRSTLVVTLEDDVQEFMAEQGTIDPTGFITMLIKQDMARKGATVPQKAINQQNDGQKEELEILLDQQTPAAD